VKHTIWKYEIMPGVFDLNMPAGARILSVQVQRGKPYVWALCCPDNEIEKRRLCVVGTGHSTPENIENARFVGTFQLNGGELVFHLFEAT
jgi:hypothetical protein